MRVLLFGKNSQEVSGHLAKLDLVPVSQNPEVVITYGGDGTLLEAERKFPQVPKLPIRHSQNCRYCANHTPEALLEKLTNRQLNSQKFFKLEAVAGQDRVVALNEIGVLHQLLYQGIRFQVKIDGQDVAGTIIGDGIMVATPFGSSGYFKSITGQTFASGIGVALSNTVSHLKYRVVDEKSLIEVSIVRGPAQVTSDNNPKLIQLAEGGQISITKSPQMATILSDSLSCLDCVKTH